MLRKKLLYLNVIILVIVSLVNVSYAKDYKLAVEHGNKDLFAYAISLMQLALSNKPEHSFTLVDKPNLTQGRLFSILISEQDEYNVVISGSTPDYIDKAYIVKVPISRGLLGNRLFVINKSNYALFDSVNTLDQLRDKVTIGSGYHWIDTDVFRYNGFNVEVAEFEQLYKMLQKNRYGGFNRGMFEAYSEVDIYQGKYPDIVVYPDVMVRYKFDYFYFTKTAQLRDELQLALESLYESGQFLQHFLDHPQIKNSLDKINTDTLRIFELENPYIHEELNNIPPDYWHDIAK